MTPEPSLDALLAEGRRHPVEGWDLRWLRDRGRFEEGPLPWDYDGLVRAHARTSPDLLDLGTGGGERLASFAPHPSRTVATESYLPNVPIAHRRLAPLGIEVVRTAPTPDNAGPSAGRAAEGLPFRDGAFHLVIDRNEAFDAREVGRVLAKDGTFLTEQSGSAEIPAILDLLGLPNPADTDRPWDLDLAEEQVANAGLTLRRSGAADFEMLFRDVGALVWYLRMLPWTAPGFSPVRQRSALERLHAGMRTGAPLRIPRRAFWLEATR